MIISNHKVSYKDASNQRGLRSNPQVIRGPNTKLSKLKMVTPTSYHFHASKLVFWPNGRKKSICASARIDYFDHSARNLNL